MACTGTNLGPGYCPSLPSALRNFIPFIPRPFRVGDPSRGHLGSSKIGPDKQVTLFLEPLPKPLALQVCCEKQEGYRRLQGSGRSPQPL